ncbi:unnamed protein product [Closterium sp. Naga37s-1]|nr:unnamed protein product [Closterium sp. Naga37s-1]
MGGRRGDMDRNGLVEGWSAKAIVKRHDYRPPTPLPSRSAPCLIPSATSCAHLRRADLPAEGHGLRHGRTHARKNLCERPTAEMAAAGGRRENSRGESPQRPRFSRRALIPRAHSHQFAAASRRCGATAISGQQAVRNASHTPPRFRVGSRRAVRERSVRASPPMHGVPAVVTSSHGHRHAPFLAAARPSPRSLGALCLLAVAALALLAAAVHSPLAPRLAARRATSRGRGTTSTAAAHSVGPFADKTADRSAPATSQPSILPLPLGSHHARGRQVGDPTSTDPTSDADAGSTASAVVVATAGAATTDGQSVPLTTAGAAANASAEAESSTGASDTAEAYVAGVPEQCSMQRSTDYDGDALTWGLDFLTPLLPTAGDPPKLNFQGRYADEFRAMHPTAPEAVQWVAGVI